MARKKRPTVAVDLDGYSVPPELLDPDHRVWLDREVCLRFLREHGLESAVVPADRIVGGRTHPHNRRDHASAAWGRANGITADPGHADWNQLRAMGLIG